MDGPIEGASAAVELLKKFGKRVVYVSNNTTRSAEGYDQLFKHLHFDANFVRSPLSIIYISDFLIVIL